MKPRIARHTRDVRGELGTRKREFPAALPSKIVLKKILVPVDFSELSWKALGYAASFAKQFKAEILLLHVIEPVLPPPEMGVIATPVLVGETDVAARKRL